MLLNCKKCEGRVFVDRVHSAYDHLEIFCINCGERKMFHPPSRFDKDIQWLDKIEKSRVKIWNGL
jgi:5-methylcytosine-specific restriction endonuclease McrA